MKKFIIPVILFFIIAVGSIIIAVSMSYSRVQYGKETFMHLARMEDGEELIAEYNGETTKITAENANRIMNAISVSETDYLVTKPEYNGDTAITLEFSDGATYIVAHDESEDDSIFVIYSYDGKEFYLKTKGYNSFSWVERGISPQGILNENEKIN